MTASVATIKMAVTKVSQIRGSPSTPVRPTLLGSPNSSMTGRYGLYAFQSSNWLGGKYGVPYLSRCLAEVPMTTTSAVAGTCVTSQSVGATRPPATATTSGITQVLPNHSRIVASAYAPNPQTAHVRSA
jgi:hypothetical protein